MVHLYFDAKIAFYTLECRTYIDIIIQHNVDKAVLYYVATFISILIAGYS